MLLITAGMQYPCVTGTLISTCCLTYLKYGNLLALSDLILLEEHLAIVINITWHKRQSWYYNYNYYESETQC